MATKRLGGIATSASVPDNGGDHSGGGSGGYVDDVFSTYLYEGNGGTQTIENGIDLANEGGLVWVKNRTSGALANRHVLTDTEMQKEVNGLYPFLSSNMPDELNPAGSIVSFNEDGFASFGNQDWSNKPGEDYVSWTFRKAPNFFDVVTYTGDGVAGREIPHGLGCEVGFAIVKRTDAGTHWYAQHKDVDLTGNKTLYLSLPGPLQVSNNAWNSTHATSENLIVGDHSDSNGLDGEYVAYLFAHDDSDKSVIKCGSFTTDASGNATVSLGWEPQFILRKSSGSADNWNIADTMRGLDATATVSLYPNTSDGEYSGPTLHVPTGDGFEVTATTPSTEYIYIAIRKPDTP